MQSPSIFPIAFTAICADARSAFASDYRISLALPHAFIVGFSHTMSRQLPLDKFDIYRAPTLAKAQSCPNPLYVVFELIEDTKNLRVDRFATSLAEKDGRSDFDTNSAHGYDMRLKLRASALSRDCSDPIQLIGQRRSGYESFCRSSFSRSIGNRKSDSIQSTPFIIGT